MGDVPDSPIFLVRFAATRPGFVATINAWIATSNSDDAVDRAKTEIEKAGWTVGKLGEAILAHPECAGRQYYEQALIDKEVLVIYQAPSNTPESE